MGVADGICTIVGGRVVGIARGKVCAAVPEVCGVRRVSCVMFIEYF